MSDEPASIKNLKKYSNARYANDEDVDASVADLSAESDRGAIILAATGIEDILEYRILQHLPAAQTDEEARKRLFENDGSIASFSKKIWMAYALGIIDKEYRKKIDLVREIRNACAHSRLPLSMEKDVLQAACKLVMPDMLPHLIDQTAKTLRTAFTCKCAFIQHYVVTGEKLEGVEAHLRHVAKLNEEAAKAQPGTSADKSQ